MDDIEAVYQTAMLEHQAGRLDVAEPIYGEILALQPGFARAWHLLGVLRHQRGDSLTAIEYIERAIGLEPQWAVFHSNLAVVAAAVGQRGKSVAALKRMMEIEPPKAKDWLKLAYALCDADQCDEAIDVFRRVLALDAKNIEALNGLALTCGELGLVNEAIEVYHRASQVSSDPGYRILAATQLPLVYESEADVLRWRQRLVAEVDGLLAAGVVQDLDKRAARPVFDLAHQGMNDLEIQRKLMRLYRAADSPELPAISQAADDKIRVGFVSKFFDSHTIGKLTRGLIRRLSREWFHVTVFSIGQYGDAVARDIATAADRYVVLPRELVAARQSILSNAVDVLVYTDIGMDTTTYSLAFSRLAPVQCVTWGHPETTGLETIDYFVSSAEMETAEADSHYSERLVRLPSLTFYYHRSELPQQMLPREAFGFDPNSRLYSCPQSIYKFHPAFDAALAGILRRDLQGQVVLIDWAYRQADELLKQRFARVMPDVADRIVFVRRMKQPEFMNFLTLADVLLDPFPYGGGNSSLEAFSFGVPVVTLPTEFLRGRITQAFCRRLGVDACIARDVEDYVEIAVRLGTDRMARDQVHRQILANQSGLFEEKTAVHSWEDFLQSVVQR
ncbi:MAG TPA: tetratricopeptide repeat protein [Pirellulaceae bacterium]|jgi:predicted O-linked N-acetylglucosamine transferase (SPINDLY family)